MREEASGQGGAEILAELQQEDARLVTLLPRLIALDKEGVFFAVRRSYNPPQSSWWWYIAEPAAREEHNPVSSETLFGLATIAILLASLVGGLVLALRLGRSESSLTDLSTYLQVLLPILAATALTNLGRQFADTFLRVRGVKDQYMARGRMVLALILLLVVLTALFSLPAQAVWHNFRGNQAFDRKNLPAALDAFQQAVSLDPSNAAAFYNLANTYDELSRPDEAIAAYRRALALSEPPLRMSSDSPAPAPTLTWFAATNNLAQLLTLYGEDADAATAVAILTRALAVATPDLDQSLQAALFRNRAFAQLSLGHFRNAADDLAAATGLAPDAAATGCVRGLLYEHKENPLQNQDVAMDGWFACLGASPADRLPAIWSAMAQERYRSSQ